MKRILYFINEKISKLEEDERENMRDNITDLTLAKKNSVFLQEEDTEKTGYQNHSSTRLNMFQFKS